MASPLAEVAQLRDLLTIADSPDEIAAILARLREIYAEHGDLYGQLDAMRLERSRKH